MKNLRKASAWTLLALLVLMMAACGGGGGGTSSGPATPPPTPPTPTPVVFSTTSLPDAVEGQPYTAQLMATGGSGPLWYAFASTHPNWMLLDTATGKITGTPTYSDRGTTLVGFAVNDSRSQQHTYIEFPINVNLQMQSLQVQFGAGTKGMSYSGSASFIGGVKPYVIDSVTGVPPGIKLTMDSGIAAKAEGTPTTAGEYDLKINVKDSANPPQVVSTTTHISIDSRLRIVTTYLPPGKYNQPYTAQVQVINGVPPYTFSDPALSNVGLSIDNTGKITGTNTMQPDPYLYYMSQLTVRDSTNASDTQTIYVSSYRQFTVVPPRGVMITHVGESYPSAFTYFYGIWPYHLSLQFGELPPGMTIDPNNYWLQGVATKEGSYKFGLHMTDSSTPPDSVDALFEYQVLPPRLFGPTDTSLPHAAFRRAYSAALQVDGGTTPFSWSLSGGELPPGIALGSDGVVSGTATAQGVYAFQATVTDSATTPQSTTIWYSLAVDPSPMGRNDTVQTASEGFGSGQFEATLSPFADPADLPNPDTDYYHYTAKPGDTVYATAQRAWNSDADTVMEIVDGNGHRFQTCRNAEDDSAPIGILLDPTPSAYDDECLNDDGVFGSPDSSSLAFKVPDKGTPTTDFYVHVLDFGGRARPDMKYLLNVQGATPQATLDVLDTTFGFVGQSYYVRLSCSARTLPFMFSVVPNSGTLPPGLTLPASTTSSLSSMTGTPTTKGHYTFTMQATDSSTPPMTATKTLTINIADLPKIEFGPLPEGTTGVMYDAPYTLSGGAGGLGVSVSGVLPNGVTWANGHISGVPTEDGTFTGTVEAYSAPSYAHGNSVPYSIVVRPGPIVVQGMPSGTVGQVYDGWLTATGGRSTPPWQPFTWTLLSGSLPPGLTLNGDLLSGIPTVAGTYSFNVLVKDASAPPQTATATISVVVQP